MNNLEKMFKVFGYAMIFLSGMMVLGSVNENPILVVAFSIALMGMGASMIKIHDKLFNCSIVLGFLLIGGVGGYMSITNLSNIGTFTVGLFFVFFASMSLFFTIRDRPKISKVVENNSFRSD